jgi:hypothetical protein
LIGGSTGLHLVFKHLVTSALALPEESTIKHFTFLYKYVLIVTVKIILEAYQSKDIQLSLTLNNFGKNVYETNSYDD